MKALPRHINYLDLFSGTGGFALGLQQAGFVFKKHYFSEIDKHASANYLKNFNDAIQLGDIKAIGRKQVEKPDVITFGSPCQDISIAGKRKGLKGKRSGLFFEALRLIRLYRPRVFVFENVKGIFSSNGGKDFEAVLRAFADIGLYDLQWQLLNTAWFLPQNRERIYLVGHLRGTTRTKVFPLGQSTQLSQTLRKKRKGNKDIASAITSSYSKGVHGRGETYINMSASRISGKKENRKCRTGNVIYGIPNGFPNGYDIACEGDGIDLSFLSSNTKHHRITTGKAHTLVTKAAEYTLQGDNIRRLTPLECERLQGFPDDWTKYGIYNGEEKEISDTQRYRMLGNAVSVVTVKAVAKKLLQNDNSLGAVNNRMKYDHYSFADNGTAGPESMRYDPEQFRESVKRDLQQKKVHTKTSVEKLAASFGIKDNTEVKELTELAIVEIARNIGQERGLPVEEKYRRIVELYHSQVNLSHRTSQSILLQQYSTPAPIAYLMGVFCNIDRLHESGGYAFEPSAGNGMLTIAARPQRVYVNEVDELRRRNLKRQGFANVWDRDASRPFFDVQKNFMAVLTNPPFGKLDTKVMFNGYPIQSLEHVMAIYALDCMTGDGKAAFIIGGHSTWDRKGRLSAGKNRLFFNYLYSHYYVADVIPINGKKLYSRQGTSFNTRLILINGRKPKPLGNAPVYDKDRDTMLSSFDDLYERVMAAMETPEPASEKEIPLSASGKRYLQYLKLQERHKDALLFLRPADKDYYEVFGEAALLLINQFGQRISAELLYKGSGVPVVRLNPFELEQLFERLRRAGIRCVMAEALQSPHEIEKEKMKNEAKKLLAALRTKSLGNPEPDDIVDYDELFRQYKEKKAENPDLLYLFETPSTFAAFNEDAEALSRVGKINIIKCSENGAFKYFLTGSSKSLLFIRVPLLEEAGYIPVLIENPRYQTERIRNETDTELNRILRHIDKGHKDDLGAPYMPSSNACIVLDTQVPDSMAYETHEALEQIKEAVGGDVDNFVRDRLGYTTKTALCKALSAEQTDAVMMAIYNIEARGQGMIIGDQTGIGKGRVAAAMIRYGCQQGMKPVFLTEKANLFSDIYRDLYAIGSGRLKPFIVNGRESKTDIKDEDGNIVYQALPPAEQRDVFSSRNIPASYDFVVATYSQFNSPEKKPEKPAFLNAIVPDNILIMDEAHNSSGSSNTGNFLQAVASRSKGVVFLSATFAKRPDNMPIYAMKTAISDCNMSRDELVESIQRGGVALQEVLSSQLVAEGQMLRRERSYEGVEVNYITLEDKAEEHAAIADNITGIIRDIIAFQKDYVDVMVEELDDIAVAEGKQVDIREGTSQAGVDNTPYFSKVFNIINQMLFSIKAASVAEHAIERLREGKKPVIAFASTMGAFLEDMEDDRGLPVSEGSIINPDFSEVLRRGLEGVMRYTEKDMNGNPEHKKFEISEFPPEGQVKYASIQKRIAEVATGITISPIDVVVSMIREAGYSVAEVTGRKYELQLQSLKVGKSKTPGEPMFGKGDRVRIIGSGKTGVVVYTVKTGDIIPGRDNTQHFSYEYSVNLDGGNNRNFPEDKLRGENEGLQSAIVLSRKRVNTNDAFRQFNNNEVDVLLINQSGSTGASAHAIPTAKVSKDEVRQRVMIVLQAELDINTEVQKRGRVNRTGQILKPRYDYITSAIPAEMRLMMMLQKKLKSLDANTASNQKQSSKILDVPDFLNKYGDRVVKEYLLENPAVNQLLDDPLRLTNKTESDQGDAEAMEFAAHKVSGRVAVLSVKMQREFYSEITERYNDYVSYLQQIGEYDLEMEAMNLQAETVNSKVVKMGSGSGSVFSEDSILEAVNANVLKKPFTAIELSNLIKESLQGDEPRKVQEELIRDYKEEMGMTLQVEEQELHDKYRELNGRIDTEKKYRNLKTEQEREAYINMRERENEQAKEKALKLLHDKAKARSYYLEKLFRFYYVGRNLNYTYLNFNGDKEYIPAVFLGFVIDWKRKNPLLPSKIKLRFALANSGKYLAIPASYPDAEQIIGASADLPEKSVEDILIDWAEYVKENNTDRKVRHIVTGNLLQAFSDFRGKLVSYTTLDGKVNKGILLPENWIQDEQKQDKVSIPIIKALPLIKSLVTGHSMTTSTGIGFLRQPNGFKVIVSLSRKVAGDIYLDKDLLELVEENNFNKVSDKMVAIVKVADIERFIEILQEKHNCAVSISRHQFNSMEKQATRKRHKPIRMPEPEKEVKHGIDSKELWKLQAEALKLKLRLKLKLAA